MENILRFLASPPPFLHELLTSSFLAPDQRREHEWYILNGLLLEVLV
jgi:hypothetical protein